MSRLDELIAELCPDGVEYKALKEVYKRLKGTPITAGKMKEIDSSDGEIRVFAGGKTVINAHAEDIPKANITRVPAVLVQSRGVIDVVYYDKPFTFKNEMWAYTHDKQVSVKYLYYVLKKNINTFREAASGMGSLPQISLKVTEDFVIPIPPLEVQCEIVRILDNFTELTAELQAEIVLQKQRYSYYKDKVFEGIDKKYYVPLKTIAKQERGKNKGQLIKEAFSVTQKGIIRTSDYFGNDTKITSENTSNYYVVKPGWFAYSPSRVNVGSFNYLRVNHDVIISPLNKVFSTDIDKMIPEFLYQYMTSTIGFSSMLRYREGIEGTGRWHLEFDDMAKMEIPLIPMEKQSEIIEILMKFDTLCNDISSGLPAEIEARQKQYEYYRDKLLTFKQLS